MANTLFSILLGAMVTPLSVRPRGTINRLLEARRSESTQPRSWRDAIAPHAVLLETPRSSVRPRQLVVEPLPWPALLHCVRRHDGPWADQSQAEFLDELLWELPERDRSPLATLVRIVQERRLRASSAAIRGGQPVVCFSARPLEQLATLRRYQRHRRRWDFEPYGLAIRREWLEAQGARPVRYGDDTLWESLADAERPWFQRQTTRARRSAPHPPTRLTLPTTDWTVEDEWRAVGDVDLSTLSADAAVLFVAEDRDADRLRLITRWPIVVLRAYTIGNPGD